MVLTSHDLRADDDDAVFYLGGHDPPWDLAEDRNSIALIETTNAAGRPIALVCHATGGPCAMRRRAMDRRW